MSRGVEKSLLEIDFASLTRGPFTPSPAAWEDQVLYFLMLDRFSDGNEQGGYADASGRIVESEQPHHCGVRDRHLERKTLPGTLSEFLRGATATKLWLDTHVTH